MSQVILTDHSNSFTIYDINKREVVFTKDKIIELEDESLEGQGAPIFRPFGICVEDEFIYIASNTKLGKFDRKSFEFISLIDVPMFIATHQILKIKNKIYVSNTSNNTISICDLDTNVNKFLNVKTFQIVDFVEKPLNAYSIDLSHVNTLYYYNNRIYVCLHNRNRSKSDFFYFDENTYICKFITSAGYCCHGIEIIDNKMYSLSTLEGKLMEINLGTNQIEYTEIVDPTEYFLRGLVRNNNCLLIGCSCNIKTCPNSDSLIKSVDLTTKIVSDLIVHPGNIINDFKMM
jgi:hypothetical protein